MLKAHQLATLRKAITPTKPLKRKDISDTVLQSLWQHIIKNNRAYSCIRLTALCSILDIRVSAHLTPWDTPPTTPFEANYTFSISLRIATSDINISDAVCLPTPTSANI